MGAKGLIATGAPHEPAWLLYVKGAIIVLSLVVLALSAYALSAFAYGGAPGFTIFLAILSWIVYGLSIGLSLAANHLYFRIGFFVAQILLIIFWLSGWAWAASWASLYSGYWGNRTVSSVMGGIAGIGALVWILIIIDFVFFTLGCVRENDSTAGTTTTNVELGKGPQPSGPVAGQQQYNDHPQYAQQQQYAPQAGYQQQPVA